MTGNEQRIGERSFGLETEEKVFAIFDFSYKAGSDKLAYERIDLRSIAC